MKQLEALKDEDERCEQEEKYILSAIPELRLSTTRGQLLLNEARALMPFAEGAGARAWPGTQRKGRERLVERPTLNHALLTR